MTYILLHHPGCSTSRKGLALLEENGVPVTVRKYANASEALSIDELKALAKQMGGVSPRSFMRDKEAVKLELPETANDDEVYAAMVAHPKLIQRPIGMNGTVAALGRPIEKLLEIL